MGCELACVRHHHRLFLVSLPRLFVGTSLYLHRHHSIGRTIVSSTRPPSFSTSFHFLTSHRFIAFQMLSIPHANLFAYFLFSSPVASPSPSPSLIIPLGPSFSPPLALHSSISQSPSLARIQRSSRTDNIHIQVYKTSQNTSINPTLFSRFEAIIHPSAIPSHPIIHIHINMFIPLHRHRAYTHLSYNHRLQHRHLYTTSTHPPTDGQPLKFAVLKVFSCVYSPSFVPAYTYRRHAFFIP